MQWHRTTLYTHFTTQFMRWYRTTPTLQHNSLVMLPPVEPPETETAISYDKRLTKRDIKISMNKPWKISSSAWYQNHGGVISLTKGVSLIIKYVKHGAVGESCKELGFHLRSEFGCCVSLFSLSCPVFLYHIFAGSPYIIFFFLFLKRILKWTKLKHSLKGLTRFSPSPTSHSQNLTSSATEKYLVLYSTVKRFHTVLNRYENACFDVTHDPCNQYLIYQISNECEVHVNIN